MHLWRHRAFLPREVRAILLATLAWQIGQAALEFTYPTYLDAVGVPYLLIGALLSLVSFAGMFVDVPIGVLCDHTSRRKLMLTGIVILAVAGVFILTARSIGLLALAFLISGIGYQSWRVPRDAKFAALTDEQHRSKLYGCDAEVRYLGVAVGAIVGGLLIGAFWTTGIIVAYWALLAVALLIVLFVVTETNRRSFLRALTRRHDFAYKFTELRRIRNVGPGGVALLSLALLFAAWIGVLWTLQPLLYGKGGLGLSPALGGLLLACFALPGVFLSYSAGSFADRVGKPGMLFAGMFVMGVAIIGFSMSAETTSVFAFAILAAIGEVFALPALAGLIVDLAYGERKGELAGVWDMFMDIGFFIGPLLAGASAQFVGIRMTLTLTGVLFLAGTLLLFLVRPLRHRRMRGKLTEATHQSLVHVTPLRKRHALRRFTRA